MTDKENKSLFQHISEAVVEGELPKDFNLPKLADKEDEIIWADGALDGVGIYHMGFSEPNDESKTLMEKAVRAAANRQFDDADNLFGELGKKLTAIGGIDSIQGFIIDHKDELNPGNVFEYAYHAVVDSADRETVKYGFSLLELFDTESDEELRNVIRTIGLNDEFSIFAIFVMLRWDDGNSEVFNLAKKIHGWGRIHAVERIEPTTDEIKHWLLTEGVHNWVMPAYSALTCWQKSEADVALRGNLAKEEFSGIRDIIEGLLDEGPVSGISEIENGDEVIITFLNQAKRLADNIDDYEAIRSIRIHFEDEESGNTDIVSLCNEVLSTDKCRESVKAAVAGGRSIPLADELGIDYREDVFNLLNSSLEDNAHLCNALMDNPEYRARVIDLFMQKLPLSEMRTGPKNTLGLGKDYRKENALEFLMQELRDYPVEGQEFVETGLQAAPVRTRNGALYVLESWVSSKGIPLSELLPQFQELLIKLREVEINDTAKKRMDRLIGGSIVFKDEPDDDEEE